LKFNEAASSASVKDPDKIRTPDTPASKAIPTPQASLIAAATWPAHLVP